MKVAIIGVGAMGSLFAARLSEVVDVIMVGHWQDQIKAINQQGISLIHPAGHQSHHFVQAAEDLNKAVGADLVLILVKTPSTAEAARSAAKILAPDGIAITLQNGLGNLETIAAIIGPERARQGVTSEGAAMIAPGLVRHAGPGQTHLAYGLPTENDFPQERLVKLEKTASLFNQVGFETHLVENADSLIWGKLAVNAGINPLTALLQVPNGFLLEDEDAEWVMNQAAVEVAAVALALNITLPFPDAAVQARKVAAVTAVNRSSMAQDVARGATTEIDAICGPVVKFGHQLSLPTPVNQSLLTLVKQQTKLGNWQKALDNQPPDILRRLLRIQKRIQTK